MRAPPPPEDRLDDDAMDGSGWGTTRAGYQQPQWKAGDPNGQMATAAGRATAVTLTGADEGAGCVRVWVKVPLA